MYKKSQKLTTGHNENLDKDTEDLPKANKKNKHKKIAKKNLGSKKPKSRTSFDGVCQQLTAESEVDSLNVASGIFFRAVIMHVCKCVCKRNGNFTSSQMKILTFPTPKKRQNEDLQLPEHP